MTALPKVSVIIPAYNAERFLDDALDSLVAQTFSDWEALIVDDGSTDRTSDISLGWAARDSRIKLLSQPNGGVSAARNAGIAKARGEFLAMLDADDSWLPSKLELQVAAMEKGEADVVYCTPTFCDITGRTASEPNWERFQGPFSPETFFVLQYTNFFLLPSSAMLRASVLEQVGGFDASLRSCEDWEMWLKLSQAGFRFFGQSERLLRYRRHSEGLSHQGDFAAALVVFPRYSGSPWLSESQRCKPFRLTFRNSFTFLGAKEGWEAAKPMFDAYRPHDADGVACRILYLLRHLLPTRLFWLAGRYVVIPAAWHFERLGERLERGRR